MKNNHFVIFYKIFLILLFFFILGFVFISCNYSSILSQKKIESLRATANELESELNQSELKLVNYNILTNNLNKLLSTVYYGSAVSTDFKNENKSFTAFSLFYNNSFYLITAGHCIEDDGVEYKDFKFKSNTSSGYWIYPKLIKYQIDHENNNDFAIFYSLDILKGLIIDSDFKEPSYVLGNTENKLNLFKEFTMVSESDCGSPILNTKSKVVGIVIKDNINFTPIEKVTDSIDKLPIEFNK